MEDDLTPKGNIKDKIKEATKKTIDTIKSSIEDETNYNLYSAFGYIPIIGWIIPKLKKRNSLCDFHSRQSLKITVAFLVYMLVVWFLGNAPVISWLFPVYVIDTLYFIGVVVYILSLLIGAYLGYKGEEKDIPFVSSLIDGVFNQMIKREYVVEKDSSNKKSSVSSKSETSK